MHFSVIVAVGDGETLEQVLAPFDEELSVPEYVRDIVSRTEMESFMEYYHEKYPTTADCKDFEKLYEDFGESWNGGIWKKDPADGQWKEFVTWNPDAQWDWYQIGGRWDGKLCGMNEMTVEEALADEDFPEVTAYAIVRDGKWIELEDDKLVMNHIGGLPMDTILYNVDCHI